MPFNVGPLELIIVLIIALLVVGPRRLPEMGNAVGKTIREFRRASSDIGEAASIDPEPRDHETPRPNTLLGEAKPNTMSQAPTSDAEPKRDDA
ncbi:MAG TPA: twin-arginine translocase TatA/TatE family subunit [Anaerolineae bacterium]|nr:twin-arginine translocase TatA/TatE family subunit [Anaerolineae bacterium]